VARRALGFDMRIPLFRCIRRELPPHLDATFHDDADEMLAALRFPRPPCAAAVGDARWPQRQAAGAPAQGRHRREFLRRPVVDDEALNRGARSGHVAAAGLDVFTGEPRRKKNPATDRFPIPSCCRISARTVETRTAMGNRGARRSRCLYAAGSRRTWCRDRGSKIGRGIGRGQWRLSIGRTKSSLVAGWR